MSTCTVIMFFLIFILKILYLKVAVVFGDDDIISLGV